MGAKDKTCLIVGAGFDARFNDLFSKELRPGAAFPPTWTCRGFSQTCWVLDWGIAPWLCSHVRFQKPFHASKSKARGGFFVLNQRSNQNGGGSRRLAGWPFSRRLSFWARLLLPALCAPNLSCNPKRRPSGMQILNLPSFFPSFFPILQGGRQTLRDQGVNVARAKANAGRASLSRDFCPNLLPVAVSGRRPQHVRSFAPSIHRLAGVNATANL